MYNWHRQYDPSLDQYIQPDPIADILTIQPVNLDGSMLIANGGISGGSQLTPSVASAPDTGSRTGAELPTFTDGPSIFNYAKSAPGMLVDPDGTRIKQVMSLLRKVMRNAHFEGPNRGYSM